MSDSRNVPELADWIRGLDDAAAIAHMRLLADYTAAEPGEAEVPQPELARALGSRFGASARGEALSEGELARSLLLVLVEDPARRRTLETLRQIGAEQRYAVLETAMVMSAVSVLLSTHLNIERTRDGQWSFKLEKKALSSPLLQRVVRAFLALFEEESSD